MLDAERLVEHAPALQRRVRVRVRPRAELGASRVVVGDREAQHEVVERVEHREDGREDARDLRVLVHPHERVRHVVVAEVHRRRDDRGTVRARAG